MDESPELRNDLRLSVQRALQLAYLVRSKPEQPVFRELSALLLPLMEWVIATATAES